MTESEYLEKKVDRTPAETVRYLRLRLTGDNTKPDARLMIIYEEPGVFRRVFARSLTGAEIEQMVQASERLHDQQRDAE